jgi:CheY-like chemotaxis protein
MNRKGHVLVVDDNVANQKLASDLLEWEGYQLSQAGDAEQAIKLIAENPPDLILMDIGLPGMDGLSLTRKSKANPTTAHIRVVALTAFAMKGDEQKVLEAGCSGYISKPIDTRTMPAQVAQFMERGASQ